MRPHRSTLGRTTILLAAPPLAAPPSSWPHHPPSGTTLGRTTLLLAGALSPNALTALLTPSGSGFHVDFNAALEALQTTPTLALALTRPDPSPSPSPNLAPP